MITESSNYPGHSQSSQAPYTSKPQHNYQQQTAIYTGNKSPGKSYPASQSAFTSYPNHYAHQQQKQIPESYPGYPRMQQPSGKYTVSCHCQSFHYIIITKLQTWEPKWESCLNSWRCNNPPENRLAQDRKNSFPRWWESYFKYPIMQQPSSK